MTHRESILPTNEKQTQRLKSAQWLHQQWRARAGQIAQYPELDLALGLIFTLAPSKPVLVNTMAAITPKHWDSTTRRLSIPAEEPLTHQRSLEATYDMTLPGPLNGPVKRHLRNWPVLGDTSSMRPEALTSAEFVEWLDARRMALGAILTRQLKRWCKTVMPQSRSLTLTILCQTAPQVLVQRGMPGQLAVLLQSAPLPTTSTTPFLRTERDAALGPGINRGSVQSRIHTTSISTVSADDALTVDPEWAERDAWKVGEVMRLVRQARETLIEQGRGKQRSESAFSQALNDAQRTLVETEAVQGSFAQLLLMWIAHMARNTSGPKPSSIRTYSNRLLRPGLLAAPVALSMADWDADDVVDVIDLVGGDQAHWSLKTYTNFLQNLAFFISFVRKLGYAEQAYVPGTSVTDQASTFRQAVLGPGHLDKVIEQALIDAQHAETEPEQILHEQIALVLVLSFYGGMRSGEIRQLTLADLLCESTDRVCFDAATISALLGSTQKHHWPMTTDSGQGNGGRVYVNILRGKTPAARRRLSLHAMAPNRWLEWLRGYIERRLVLSQRSRFDRISLLLPMMDGKTSLNPIQSAIDYLAGFYGSQRDLHGLRHAGASLHFLRIGALRSPELVPQLSDRDHPVFSDESLQRLRTELEMPQGKAVWDRGLAEHWLARTLGHSQLHTTISTYVHTASALHSQWVEWCGV